MHTTKLERFDEVRTPAKVISTGLGNFRDGFSAFHKRQFVNAIGASNFRETTVTIINVSLNVTRYG